MLFAGADFIVHMDHQTLRYFLTQTKLSEKYEVNQLFVYVHFEILHANGKKNVVGDTLSRRPHVLMVSIVFYDELDVLKEQYALDKEFCNMYEHLVVVKELNVTLCEMILT